MIIIWRIRFARWVTMTTDTLRTCNTYCFFSETVVTRTHLNIRCICMLPVLLCPNMNNRFLWVSIQANHVTGFQNNTHKHTHTRAYIYIYIYIYIYTHTHTFFVVFTLLSDKLPTRCIITLQGLCAGLLGFVSPLHASFVPVPTLFRRVLYCRLVLHPNRIEERKVLRMCMFVCVCVCMCIYMYI
jgi:hypothetical protein